MSNPNSRPVMALADALMLLRKKPRTITELATLVEVSVSTMSMWLRIFRDEGHIVEAGIRGSGRGRAVEWRWRDQIH